MATHQISARRPAPGVFSASNTSHSASTRVFVIDPPKERKQFVPTSPSANLVTISDTVVILQHTPGHVNCRACSKRSLVRNETPLATMLFPDAFEAWMAARVMRPDAEKSIHYIRPKSEATFREYGKALSIFFRHLRISEIHDGHLRSYQDARATGDGEWLRRCGQNRIRKETGILVRIMRAAGVWVEDFQNAYRHLPQLDTDVQRVMEPAEQEHLLKVTASKPEWVWVHDYIMLALHTCASTQELRMLRFKDIDTQNYTVRIGVEASKNRFRNRTIPLEDEAVILCVARLMERARGLGCTDPAHYIFPFGFGSKWANSASAKARGAHDVARPMTKYGLKNTWDRVRKTAEVPWLRPYDLRHTAITRMAEAGEPVARIMAFAGISHPE